MYIVNIEYQDFIPDQTVSRWLSVNIDRDFGAVRSGVFPDRDCRGAERMAIRLAQNKFKPIQARRPKGL